jgi:hypothetical protein
LRSERSYVAGLYARLDAERARVTGEYNAALRGNGGTPLERDVEVRALAREVKRLDVADDGLCFGRLDTLSGEHLYIGRIGLLDEGNDYEPVLLDWRAPTPPVPHPRASRGRFHRRGARPPERWRAGGRGAPPVPDSGRGAGRRLGNRAGRGRRGNESPYLLGRQETCPRESLRHEIDHQGLGGLVVPHQGPRTFSGWFKV